MLLSLFFNSPISFFLSFFLSFSFLSTKDRQRLLFCVFGNEKRIEERINSKKKLENALTQVVISQNKQTEKRKISVYGTEEDPEGEAVEDGGRTMAEQIKASVSKGVDKVKLM